jgi:hypothetical protein
MTRDKKVTPAAQRKFFNIIILIWWLSLKTTYCLSFQDHLILCDMDGNPYSYCLRCTLLTIYLAVLCTVHEQLFRFFIIWHTFLFILN